MQFLLKLAKSTIEEFVKNRKTIQIPEKHPEEFDEKRGVFVSIYKKHSFGKELRGCIGYPYPQMPLIVALIDASIAACKDPRFESLKKEELKDISIEILILTEPELIKVRDSKEYLKKIEIGRDGLIIKKGIMQGLLLPQVPIEQNWSAQEFLENLCLKAGLVSDAWKDLSSKVYKFQAEILTEKL